MKVLHRFTRDRLSRYLWGGLTVAFAILIVFAASGSRRDLADREAQTQARAVAYTESTLFQNLDAHLMSGPILGPGYRDLLIPVQAEIMTDPAVARVRIWGPDGSLLFSTDERENIGTVHAHPTPALEAAFRGHTSSTVARTTVSIEQGIPPTTAQLYQTFVPIHVPDRTAPVGAAEIDAYLAPMVAASHGTWRTLEVVFAVGFLLVLLMTLLSLRKPIDRPAVSEPAASVAALPADATTASAPVPTVVGAAPGGGSVSRAGGESSSQLRELQDQLMQEQMRRANAERAARDAEVAAEAAAAQRAQVLEMEVRRLRERLEGAPDVGTPDVLPGSDVGAIRLELESVRRELEGVRAEVHAARTEREDARAEAERTHDEPEPNEGADPPESGS
jgi:hypothetical protein